MCMYFDKPTDLFHDTLKNLIFEKVGESEERLKAIME